MKTIPLLSFCLAVTLAGNVMASQAALSFDGATAYGETPVAWAPVQNATYECWVRIEAYNPQHDYFGVTLGRWGWWTSYHPAINSATGAVRGIEGIGHSSRTADGLVTAGEWHHLAAVTGGNASPGYDLYLNGVLVLSEGPGTEVPGSTTTLCLGAINYLGWRDFFLGEIDEARISTVRRYEGDFTPSRTLASDSHTYGLWHFDEGLGSIAMDSSGNGRDFQLHGGFAWVDGVDPQPALSHSSASAGGLLDLAVQGAEPGSMVYFCYSFNGPGPTTIPWGVTLELSSPILGGRRNGWHHMASTAGKATMSVVIPPRLAGVTVWSQAFEDSLGVYRTSNLTQTTVQ